MKVEKVDDEHRRRILVAALDKMKVESDALAAANLVYSVAGLHPMYWGVSKEQLRDFREKVRTAITDGRINGQPDPDKPFYYDPAKFKDPTIGPNMHQVNAGLIKPLTQHGTATEPAFMPGLSYALMHNYATGGRPCKLFFSHVRHLLASSPHRLRACTH